MNIFTEFLKLGFEHISQGYDHLLFLAALVIVSKDLRSILSVISAFTIAHSTTLVLSALGVLSFPSLLTEAMIAVSIVYVGMENIIAPNQHRRWIIAGLFGFVHGAGFSGHLVGILKPLLGAGYIWGPIMGFNIGIELGQLCVIAILFPLVRYASNRSWERKVVIGASGTIALIGLVLLILRLAGVDA